MLADGPLTAERAGKLAGDFAELTTFGDHADLTLYFKDDSSELRLTDRDGWPASIVENWDRIGRLSCSDYGQRPPPRLEADRATGMIRVDLPVQDADLETAKKDSLKTLKLVAADGDLYRYRKTAVTYEAAGWDVTRFANALKATVDNLTKGGEPQVREAHYAYEHSRQKHVERLRGFFDVDEMIASLKAFAGTDGKAAELRNIGLGINGPVEIVNNEPIGRALGIGVRVAPAPVQITFRSSLRPETLSQVIAPIREAVELGDKAVAARYEGSSASGTEAKTEDGFWIKSLVVPVLAALATTVMSTAVLQAMLSDYELELSSPVEKGAEYVMEEPGPLELRWHARTTDRLWTRRDFDVPAQVEVVQNGQVVNKVAGRSRATVKLSAGNFVIVVRPDEDIDPVRITVKVAVP